MSAIASCGIDHLVLTVASIARSVELHVGVLGMTRQQLDGRTALRFGAGRIKLHEVGHLISPHARHAVPGSADPCFVVDDELVSLLSALGRAGVPLEAGPAERTGALGRMVSAYVRDPDPDQNLIELWRHLWRGHRRDRSRTRPHEGASRRGAQRSVRRRAGGRSPRPRPRRGGPR